MRMSSEYPIRGFGRIGRGRDAGKDYGWEDAGGLDESGEDEENSG
jgi:hypothetical protein